MKYVDTTSIVQVIGNIYLNNNLLDNPQYSFNEEDFPTEFHKIIFGSIYNLHLSGVKKVTPLAIEDYLEQRPQVFEKYKMHKGRDWLEKIGECVQSSAFDYYYKRLKKFTLLRMYESVGVNLDWFYDPDNVFDTKKKQEQEDIFDNTSIDKIAELIDEKVTKIRMRYVDNYNENSVNASKGIRELIYGLKESPEVGVPLYGSLFNTITKGARLNKFYLRSASSGTGKTRAMIADACVVAFSSFYDKTLNKWTPLSTREDVLYITTEQEIDEIQTMIVAFLSGVNEEHILLNKYENGEWERVERAMEIIEEDKFHMQLIPDFSLTDIENTIKQGISQYKCKYIFYDYLHTSMKILSEVTSKTSVKGLREDNILFMLSIRLKDLCNQYGVFIMSSTQLNGDYKNAKIFDQNLLRGAKSIADKVDYGSIMLDVTDEDLSSLKSVLEESKFVKPDTKVSIYKNRRGQYNKIIVWCKTDKGCCRFDPVFVTDYNYKLIDIKRMNIKVK